MISRKFFFPIFLFAFLNLHLAKAQTATANNVYLWYYVNTDMTTIYKSPYYNAKIRTPFTLDDYNKMLKLSGQRVYQHTLAGDSLTNYDWAFEFGPYFNCQRDVVSSAEMPIDDFKKDPCIIGPVIPYYWSRNMVDHFRMQNGKAVASKVSVGSDFRFQTGTDTSMVTAKNGKQTLKLTNNYLEANETAMSFIEKWSFDPMTGIFGKDVSGNGFFEVKVDPSNNETIGYSPLIFLENPNGNYNPKTDILLKKNVIIDESMQTNEASMQTDSMWMNAKPSDIIQTLQYGFGEIPSCERVKFLSSIFYYAFHNPTKVFPVKNMIIDSLHPFQTSQQIQNVYCTWDSTNQIEDPQNPGKFVFAPIRFTVLIGNIYAIRFYEDWYYDPKEMTIKKHVNGIGFIEIKRDMNNQPSFSDTGIYLKVN